MNVLGFVFFHVGKSVHKNLRDLVAGEYTA